MLRLLRAKIATMVRMLWSVRAKICGLKIGAIIMGMVPSNGMPVMITRVNCAVASGSRKELAQIIPPNKQITKGINRYTKATEECRSFSSEIDPINAARVRPEPSASSQSVMRIGLPNPDSREKSSFKTPPTP